jgi:hypothetical protein
MLRGIVIYGEEWVYRRVRGEERGERVWVLHVAMLRGEGERGGGYSGGSEESKCLIKIEKD